METYGKRQKMWSETSDDETNNETSDEEEEKRTIFRPTNVTFVVEGQQMHLNKERLSENSVVFKAMFESNFKEKNMKSIPLDEKKWEDFEQFICSFYFPGYMCPITEETVFKILPLAEEYQVLEVKNRCEAFIAKSIKMTKKEKIDAQTFVNYVKLAEMFILKNVLCLVPKYGARYAVESLNEAGVEEKLSVDIRMNIYKERCKLLERSSKDSADKSPYLKIW